ncbi:MAG: hypothetical protein M0005_16295 [Actinomycetota bacterium]|nr:hypothetical protein [Actinomycetota bacterium]
MSVFGLARPDAVRAGLVGGMLQVGLLVNELTVRELVSMVAALLTWLAVVVYRRDTARA